MKIVHFHPDGFMAARFVAPLIVAEIDAGNKSTLIVDRNIKHSELKLRYDLRLSLFFKFPYVFIKLFLFFHKYKPDIVISHNSRSSPIPLLLSFLFGIKHRVYYNHGVPYSSYKNITYKILKFIEIFNIYFSTRIITVSEAMKNEMINLLPTIKIKPEIISFGSACGIDLKEFTPKESNDIKWRSIINCSESDILVTFIGRPVVRKGFLFVVNLWLSKFNSDKFKLILCGVTEFDLLKHIDAIPNNIICLGFVENIHEVLKNSNILISPSLHEGLSYAILESMATGLVVVANNIPANNQLITNNFNGFLVDNNSFEQYFNIISSVDQKENFKYITDNAILSASKFSRDLFIKEYIKFIKSFL